jgi:hypothetical protein
MGATQITAQLGAAEQGLAPSECPCWLTGSAFEVASVVTASGPSDWSVRLLWDVSRTVYSIWPVWPLAKSQIHILVVYQRVTDLNLLTHRPGTRDKRLKWR